MAAGKHPDPRTCGQYILQWPSTLPSCRIQLHTDGLAISYDSKNRVRACKHSFGPTLHDRAAKDAAVLIDTIREDTSIFGFRVLHNRSHSPCRGYLGRCGETIFESLRGCPAPSIRKRLQPCDSSHPQPHGCVGMPFHITNTQVLSAEAAAGGPYLIAMQIIAVPIRRPLQRREQGKRKVAPVDPQ